MVSFLEHHREYSPDHPALIWADAQVSFAELASRSESLAAGLAAMGLLAGDRVFLFIPMSPELYTAMLAVHRVGAIAVFLDSWARRGELENCLAQTSPHCFIGSEDALHWLRGRPTSIAIMLATGTPRDPSQPCLTTLANTGYSIPVAPVDGEHTALVTYTTGSSGKPRGANRTHRFLAAQHRALAKCLPYSTNDIDLPVFPIFSLNNLACGVTTVLPTVDLAQPGETDGDELFQQMLAAKVTTCTLS
ncbi:MAG TPA: AMP-binding protein, partial [bacterium]|nr:AMP-binding protein [bacterium]